MVGMETNQKRNRKEIIGNYIINKKISMVDYNLKTVDIGDSVTHRWRDYPTGKVVKIEDGCNAVCWVDFNQTVLGKKHLTICVKTDIIKEIK